MPLTEEQKERIRKNRERAIQIRQKRLLEQQQQQQQQQHKTNEGKKQKLEKGDPQSSPPKESTEDEKEEDIILEDFEQCASEYVSKREAKEKYCLPEGTLAICSFIEKENPFRKGFTNMKLYKRSEIRTLSRKRFGGLEGLIAEREKRERKRYVRDLEDTKNIFK